MSEEQEYESQGWDAIDQALESLYGEQQAKHYGTAIPYMLGGEDPLDGISVYESNSPAPHWHFVTYGFSELYEKESDDEHTSGYGFELTFRLKRQENEEEPPSWAINLLQNMGRYVFGSGNVFHSGDYLDANGPICLASDTSLTALAFKYDAELASMDTPNGKVEFLQMVGITSDELEAMQTWNTAGLLMVCEPYMKQHITDLDRQSLLNLPAVTDAVSRGIEEDGSSTGYLFIDQLIWQPGVKKLLGKKPAVLTIGAKQAGTISKLLRGRLLKNKTLSLINREKRVFLQAGDSSVIEEGEEGVTITLDSATITELSILLEPKQKTLSLTGLKELQIAIAVTEIKDNEGNVVETIG